MGGPHAEVSWGLREGAETPRPVALSPCWAGSSPTRSSTNARGPRPPLLPPGALPLPEPRVSLGLAISWATCLQSPRPRLRELKALR